MAVEIPVVIDIDAAFEDAAKRVGTAIKPLQDYIDENTLKLRLKIDESSSKSLKSILKDASLSSNQLNAALADVEKKIQKIANSRHSFDMVNGLTDKETRLLQAYTILQRKITGIGNTSTATQKLISINITKVKKEIDSLSVKLKNADKGSTKFKNLNNNLIQAKQNLRNLNTELANLRAQDSLSGLESSLTRSNSRLVTLIKNSVRLIALHSASRFIRNVREVTAEFEMQRVALGSIIQDTEQANMLFRQIKAAAIESPFQIKDLVSYTKQLSAYRVETANLFDVTKRLADVSAGLGVDMGRIILAYGQVRAASVLRGQELRQFTEAGIPLVSLLAEKFQELRGSVVSTSEVFDLISKRAVPFEMIADIFEDMTNKGGVFYKMQEKQAETLAGQWSNLKDAVSIMYDEIGNTTVVHSAMEKLISDARSLMTNWRQVGIIFGSLASNFAILKIGSLFVKKLSFDAALAQKATISLAKATELEATATGKANIKRAIAIGQLKQYAKWAGKAAAAETLAGRGVSQFLAKFLGGGWISMAVTAVSLLVGWLISVRKEANRLNKELEKIETEGTTSINRTVGNFIRLANAAVDAADGSNEQNTALEELKRTYGDIIPSQNLQIEKLKELEGNYSSLTSAIQQKINMQIREQKINAATDYYAGKITKSKRTAKKYLQQYGLDKEQINAVLEEIQKAVDDGTIKIEQDLSQKAFSFEAIIKRLTGIVVDLGNGFRDFEGNWHSVNDAQNKALKSMNDISNVYFSLHGEINDIENEMESSVGTMGVYSGAWNDLQEKIKAVTVSEEEFGNKYTFSYKKEKIRKEVEMLARAIEDAFKSTGIDISEAIGKNGTINFDMLKKAAESSNSWGLSGYIKNIQNIYESLVPSNKMVGVVERKFQEIASAVGLSMDDVQGYLLRGETDMQSYAKEVKNNLEVAQNAVKDLQARVKDYNDHPFVVEPVSKDEITKANALVQFFEMLSQFVSGWAKTGKGPSITDPFITMMQEKIKFMQDFKKGYDDLNKYMTSTEAKMGQSEIMLGRGQSLGLDANQQLRAVKDLSGWYEEMIETVQDKLREKGIKGASITDFLGVDTTKKSKAIQDLQKLLQSLWDAKTDFDTSQKKKDIEDAMKQLSDEIKRSETARNFYQNILDLTGDQEMASTMTVSVYGDVGKEFKDRLQNSLEAALAHFDDGGNLDLWKKMNDAVMEGDFDTIMRYIDRFPEEWQKRLKEMSEMDQKHNAELASNLLKSLQKAKSYSDKRVEISRKAAQRISDINAMEISESQKDSLRKQSAKKEAEEAAKLAYEAFKDTPMYIELFADLDRASSTMLKSMRDNLSSMKKEWKEDLAPTELRELQSRLNEIDKQLAVKNPFRSLIDSIKEYRELSKEGSRKEADAAAVDLTNYANLQKSLLDLATERYNEAVRLHGINSDEALIAKDELDTQKEITDSAIEQADAAQDIANGFRLAAKHLADAGEALQEWAGYVQTSLSGIGDIVETFSSEETASIFNTLSEGISKTIGGTAKIATGAAMGLAGIPTIISGIGDAVSGVFGTISKLKIEAINKKIEKQQELIEDLEYSYGRLENAIAKAFGSDYIYNYNQQLENLLAKQAAYEEQARLESEKGKKKDEEKIKEYKNAARDAQDQILEMKGQLSEFFTDMDLTSAAEDFASAWIDAYKEFGSTTDAMKEKFNDMIQSMIQKSLGAKIMQTILQPLFEEIDRMATDGALTADEIAQIGAEAPTYIAQMNDAMTTLMNQIGAAGYNMRQQVGGFTGISRNIAGATEESINGLAAGINTQNFYISHIDNNVASILAALTGGASIATPASGALLAEEVDPFKDTMLSYASAIPVMRDDMSAIRSMLDKVVKPAGVKATHYVATNA